jgi:hypothetical protein
MIAPIPATAGFAAPLEILGIVRIREPHEKVTTLSLLFSLVRQDGEVIENQPEKSYPRFQ